MAWTWLFRTLVVFVFCHCIAVHRMVLARLSVMLHGKVLGVQGVSTLLRGSLLYMGPGTPWRSGFAGGGGCC